MNPLQISFKNIKYRPLSSFLCILLLAFGTGIISLLMTASKQIENQFTKNISGIDMVIGAKGSPLQLILSAVYQIDAPTGNINYNDYKAFTKHPLIKNAIPLAYGDNYKNIRIVGTETSYINHYEAELSEGKLWQKTGEVIIGNKTAETTGLKLGDTFSGSHGIKDNVEAHDHFKYTVVGILKPSGSVLDQLILGNIESVWSVHNNEDEHHHEEENHHHHEHDKQITAALISFKSPMGNIMLPRMVNEKTNMQAALPSIEINRLFALMGTGINTLKALAILIVLISGISIFISLYQSLKERKYELALMRSMGASRLKLFSLLILEGITLTIIGYFFGLILGKTALFILSNMADKAYRYDFKNSFITLDEVYLFIALLILGFLAAFLPSLQAFKLNISKTLSNA